ncbi:CoA transferase, partial [Streptomyces sp. NPDC059233]
MASPATTQTVRPLDALRFGTSGPPQITDVVTAHLRLLGARADGLADDDRSGRVTLSGGGFEPGRATARWANPGSGLVDEATVQAATGMMAVHGRRDGAPRGLAADYAATATAVLTVQGLLAGLVGQARGAEPTHVTVGADRAALLAVSQY